MIARKDHGLEDIFHFQIWLLLDTPYLNVRNRSRVRRIFRFPKSKGVDSTPVFVPLYSSASLSLFLVALEVFPWVVYIAVRATSLRDRCFSFLFILARSSVALF